MYKINRHLSFIICSFLPVFITAFSANARTPYIDSLKNLLPTETDTAKIKTMIDIGRHYDGVYKYDTALNYYLDALKLAEGAHDNKYLFITLKQLARFYEHKENFELALEFALRARKIAEEENNRADIFEIYNFIGGLVYFNHGNYDTALAYGLKAMKIARDMNDIEKIASAQTSLGDDYRELQKFDSALYMYWKAINSSKQINDKETIIGLYNDIALVYQQQGKQRDAINWFNQSIAEAEKDSIEIPIIIFNAANAYRNINKYDSALFLAKRLLKYAQSGDFKELRSRSYRLLAEIYSAKNMYGDAYYCLTAYMALKDSLNSTAEQNKINFLESEYKTGKQKEEIELLEKNSKLQVVLRNVLIATAILLLITAFLIANKYNHKKKTEAALAVKNNELNNTVTELKATQGQLIQSEKMASLGELTAGIAHEIQNPLNFVNNFSEVSNELIDELQGERRKAEGERDEQLENELLADVKQNLEKINHHGKRADAIVKGMLQHSRKSSGIKEPTDINALADEYLRLAYHGLRAKDKNFNATLNTAYDESISKINIIPQDIGRVLLNLYNNAFYAVAERAKTAGAAQGPDANVQDLEGWKKNLQGGGEYRPAVTVTTKRADNAILITVADNGSGIQQKIVDKIFQPFFTTKPTGQGTGLGLSLSYDIIKAHGGAIRVETKEGEGTEFVITLPVKG